MTLRSRTLCGLLAGLMLILPLTGLSAPTADANALSTVILSGPPLPDGLFDGAETRAEAVARIHAAAAPSLQALREAAASVGGDVLTELTSVPAIVARAPAAALALLAASPGVAAVSENDPALHLVPFEEGVAAENRGGRRLLQAEEAWGLGFTGAGVRVAVLDTGIDPGHEAFREVDGASRVVAFRDFVNGLSTPYDDHGHGTFMAASAAGSSRYDDPAHGFFQEAGVAPGASLVVAKFLTSGGSGTFEAAIAALEWAHAQGAAVAANPWGSSGCSASVLPVLRAVRTLTDAGMVSVFPAGASGPGAGTIGGPACSESALTVGAVDEAGNVFSSSGRGPCSDPEIGGAPRVCPDVVAKGGPVRSAAPRGGCTLCDPSGYRTLSGTSPAAAFVAGAVAVAEHMKVALTGEGWNTTAREEERVIKLTARDVDAPGPDNATGWGIPQLLGIWSVLSASEDPLIVDGFSVGASVLRAGGSTPLTFSVTNLGHTPVQGEFSLRLTAPDGAVTVLKSSEPTLPFLASERFSGTFSVGGATRPGTWTVAGDFSWRWTNATTGEVVTGALHREATVLVERVFLNVTLTGLEPAALPGVPQEARLRVESEGNAPARNVVVELVLPDRYVRLPAHTSPEPTSVKEDRNFGRVTLVWAVGDLPAGEVFEARVGLAATAPGEYRSCALARYEDGPGPIMSQGRCFAQTVPIPPPIPSLE